MKQRFVNIMAFTNHCPLKPKQMTHIKIKETISENYIVSFYSLVIREKLLIFIKFNLLINKPWYNYNGIQSGISNPRAPQT